jgi:hypothetical protein
MEQVFYEVVFEPTKASGTASRRFSWCQYNQNFFAVSTIKISILFMHLYSGVFF